MINNKKLLEAAWIIKDYCEHTDIGDECPFSKVKVCNGDVNCGFVNSIYPLPCNGWNILKPCRWCKEDYELAKALSAFGVQKIEKIDGDIYWVDRKNFTNYLPKFSFCGLEEKETISLSEIIEEYEKSEYH